MDWERRDLDWSDKDFANFRYGCGESTIVRKLASDETLCSLKLESYSQWNSWFDGEQYLSQDQAEPGLILILCSRAKPLRVGPAPVSYLPFLEATFSELVKLLGIHPTIGRTIQRQSPYFAAQYFVESHPLGSIFTYTARTSSVLGRDIAMSATHFPQHCLNVGIVYGCDQKQKEEFIRRVRKGMDSLRHPMFLPGIFAEMERVRLSGIADKMLDEFTLQSSQVGTFDLLNENTDIKPKLMSLLQMSYQSQDIINVMKSTRRQLVKMMAKPGRGTKAETGQQLSLVSIQDATPSRGALAPFELTSDRFQTRVREMLDEYDDKLDDCAMVGKNMSLTMQTLWNHFAREENRVNLELSRVNTSLARVNSRMTQDMKRDSSQMRSIALLTMVFLPITAVASLFSTTIFQWDADHERTIFSGYLWVFVVLATILTITTVFVWYWCTHGPPWHRRNKGTDRDIEIEEGGEFRQQTTGAFTAV